MEKSVYIESSVISYLTARPSSNLLAVAWATTTIDWWDNQRDRFDLYISELVIEEVSRGDSEAAQRRLSVITNISRLSITEAVVGLARSLIEKGPLPASALGDALHIAASTVHELDYLLTWNCRHIDNAEIKPIIRSVCAINGYTCPEICTPQELMGGLNDE